MLNPTSVAFGREVLWSHPAFADRCIFVRNDKALLCVSLAAEDSDPFNMSRSPVGRNPLFLVIRGNSAMGIFQWFRRSASEEDVAGQTLQTTEMPKQYTNSIGMKLILIPAGTFRMGSPATEKERRQAEGPQHDVTISKPFYMSIYPVTQREYEAVMGENPAHFDENNGGSPDHPVEEVKWDEACEFCSKLSALPKERKTGWIYWLPTEAQWEYACRGGATVYTVFHYGNSLSSAQANFDGNYPYGGAAKGPFLQRTTKVGSYPPNAFGLFDMHGNVREWCADLIDHYKSQSQTDPLGPAAPAPGHGPVRVYRGGGWNNMAEDCRSADRSGTTPQDWMKSLGFRVVRVPRTQPSA